MLNFELQYVVTCAAFARTQAGRKAGIAAFKGQLGQQGLLKLQTHNARVVHYAGR